VLARKFDWRCDPRHIAITVRGLAGIEVRAALAVGSGDGLILAAIIACIVIDAVPFAQRMRNASEFSSPFSL
jgi:hypothetical protein